MAGEDWTSTCKMGDDSKIAVFRQNVTNGKPRLPNDRCTFVCNDLVHVSDISRPDGGMTGGVFTLRLEDMGVVGSDWLNRVAEARRRFATGTLTGNRMIHEANNNWNFHLLINSQSRFLSQCFEVNSQQGTVS